MKNIEIDIGIDKNARITIAQKLSELLAETFALYLKTHHYHWNVTGPQFQTLHLMFETQYNELWLATDLIAERIRALGLEAKIGAMQEFSEVPHADQMIRNLITDHQHVAFIAREMFQLAEQGNDEVSADMLTQRMQIHEKTAWMLRSLC